MIVAKPDADPEKNSGVPIGPRRTAGAAARGGNTAALSVGARIAWFRRRKGISQRVLADLVGRSESWVYKVEHDKLDLDRLSVLKAVAVAVDTPLSTLLEGPAPAYRSEPVRSEAGLAALREVLADYSHLSAPARGNAPVDLGVLKAQIGDAWSAYQDSRYTRATRLLPGALGQARLAARTLTGPEQAHAEGLLALAHQGAAMVLTKVGESDLAWLAADRGLASASRAQDPLILGSLYRSVAHCLLSTGRAEAAAGVVEHAAAALAPSAGSPDPSHQSLYGTLLLVGAVAAARTGDRGEATRFLKEAAKTASRLGYDGNHWWTAFGPTSVEMHRVAVSIEFGDAQTALAHGERLDTSALPIERRVRHRLDMACAHAQRSHRSEAEALLLDAAEMAPEQVRHHYLARKVAAGLVATGRGRPSTELAELAADLHVV